MLEPLKFTAVALAAALGLVLQSPVGAADFAFQPVGYPYAVDVASAGVLSNGRVIAAPVASGLWSLQDNGYPLTRMNANGIEGALDIQQVNEGVLALARPYRPFHLYEETDFFEAWQRASEGLSYLVRSTDGGLSWQRLAEPGFPEIPGMNWFEENVGDQRGHLPRLVVIPDGRAVLSNPNTYATGAIWRRQSNQWTAQPAAPAPYCTTRYPATLMLSMSAAGEVFTNDVCANLVVQSQPGGAFTSTGISNVRAISRQRGAHIYVATTTDVYRRDGTSFIRVASLPAAIASAIPNKPAGLFLDTLDDGTVVLAIGTRLFSSRDRGLTWAGTTFVHQGMAKDFIKQVVGRSASAAYVVTARSLDRYDLTGATATIATRKPLAPVYVGLKATATGTPLAISDTNITYRMGRAWRSLDPVPGMSFVDATVAVDGTVFASMSPWSAIGEAYDLNTVLFRRPPNTLAWTEVAQPGWSLSGRIEALSSSHLISYGHGEVKWSADGGETWSYAMEVELDGSINHALDGFQHVYVQSPSAIYAFNGYGVRKSVDGGRTFSMLYHLEYPGVTECRQFLIALNEALVCGTPAGVVVAKDVDTPSQGFDPEVRDLQFAIRTVDTEHRNFVEAVAINSIGELLIMGPFGSKLASPFTGSPNDTWTTVREQDYMTKIQWPRAVGTADDFHVVRDGSGIQRLNR